MQGVGTVLGTADRCQSPCGNVSCGTIDSEKWYPLLECPSCRMVHEGQPKFCENCGYQFAVVPLTSTGGNTAATPVLKKCPDCAEDIRAEARKCRFCGFQFPASEEAQPMEEVRSQEESAQQADPVPRQLGRVTPTKVLFALIIVAFFAYLKFGNHAASTSSSGTDSSSNTESRPSPSTSPSTAHVGDTVMVGPGQWVCASTKEAYDQISKWRVRGDSEEMLRTLQLTRSFLLVPDGFQVKILDSSFILRKVRVMGWLDPDDGRIHAYPEETRIGRECWVPFEAVTR